MQGEKLCWPQRPVLMAITEEKVTISALVPAMVTVCMEMLEYDEDYDMELVGDFTTLTLLEVCQQKGGNFADRAKAIQQRFYLYRKAEENKWNKMKRRDIKNGFRSQRMIWMN